MPTTPCKSLLGCVEGAPISRDALLLRSSSNYLVPLIVIRALRPLARESLAGFAETITKVAFMPLERK